MRREAILVAVLALAVRAPFLFQAVQGDDPYYLYGAEHAQIDPLHPLDTRYPFQGVMRDMRGHPHGPMNSWMLGALLALHGDVREARFHAAYALFSVAGALAMLALARRFCERPVWATLLLLAVPPFVVQGNTLEADAPFLAFWLGTIALFVKGADARSAPVLLVAALLAACAALAAYQAVLLVPILAAYLWLRGCRWPPAWLALLAAPLAIAVWQIWEWRTTGALPAAILLGYMREGSLQAPARKLASAAALTAHAAWIVGPLLVAAAAGRRPLWRWIAAGAAAGAAAWLEAHPLFWASFGFGVLALLLANRREFLALWIWIFFLGSLLIFFAGAARYLLPMAAPVAILIARSAAPRLLAAGLVLQLALSLALAAANYQHGEAVKNFALSVASQAGGRRVWANAELGARWYLESSGALPLLRDQILRPGDIVVTSELTQTFAPAGLLARVREAAIAPPAPLRLISLGGGSGYSTSAKGLLPFEISREPVDRLTVDVVAERRPELSYLDPKDPRAAAQIIAGLYPDGWMGREATVILKRPDSTAPLGVDVYVPTEAPARRIELLIDGVIAASKTFAQAGAYRLEAPLPAGEDPVTVSVRVDATHRAPPDQRDLGVVISGVGAK